MQCPLHKFLYIQDPEYKMLQTSEIELNYCCLLALDGNADAMQSINLY